MKTITLLVPDEADVDSLVQQLTETLGYIFQQQELDRIGAVYHNVGWGVGGDYRYISAASKTDKGIVTTNYDSETGSLEHIWSDEDEEGE